MLATIILLAGALVLALSHGGAAALEINYATVIGEVSGNGSGNDGTVGPWSNPSGNYVTIKSSTMHDDVYGGWTDGVTPNPASGVASDNIINIIDNNITASHFDEYVYGGFSTVGGILDATANGNHVNISGYLVSVDKSVYGGYAYINGGTGAATASNNDVGIVTGSVDGDVYGGYAYASSGSATGNTVVIRGSVGGDVSGGYVSGTGDAFSGNTLNLLRAIGQNLLK